MLTLPRRPEPVARERFLVSGLSILVESDDTAPITWARSYLPPDSTGPLEGNRTLRQHTAGDFAGLVAQMRGAAGPSVVRRTFKGIHHEELVFLQEGRELRAFIPCHRDYVLLRDGDVLELCMSASSREPDRHVLRVIREMVLRRLESAGGVALHAAAVAMGERGLLLVGPSGAGKTTLLVAFLLAGWRFICNDRAVLSPDGRHLLGLPLPVRLGAGTILGVPALRHHLDRQNRLERAQQMSWQELQAAGGLEDEHWGSPKKLELSPIELCRLLGTTPRASAPIRAIIVPSIHRGPRAPRLEQLHPSEALTLLDAERCTPDDPLWPEPWVEPRPLTGDARGALQALTERTPAWRLHFGTSWLETLEPVLRHGLEELA